jgi:hypothetical protein
MFDFTLHAGTRCHFLFHKHVFVAFMFIGFQQNIYIYIYIYIYWGENAKFLFFLLIVFQILYMFLSDISVHCALIEYAYIRLRVYV